MKRRNNKHIFFGITIVVVATLLLLSSLNLVVGNIVYLAISAALLLYGISAVFGRSFYVGLWSIAFAFKYSETFLMPYIDLTVVSYWQLFLITSLLAFGLDMLFGRKKHFKYEFDRDFDIPEGHEHSNIGDTYVGIQTYMKETTRYIYSTELETVQLETKMGSSTIFFQERELKNNLDIFVDCKLGNIQLFIPKEWSVIENIQTSLGNVEVKHNYNQMATKGPHTVYISGSVALGSIEINFI